MIQQGLTRTGVLARLMLKQIFLDRHLISF